MSENLFCAGMKTNSDSFRDNFDNIFGKKSIKANNKRRCDYCNVTENKIFELEIIENGKLRCLLCTHEATNDNNSLQRL